MIDNGDLQRIHDKWLLSSACLSQGSKLEVERLQLKSFWGLYAICGIACLLALFMYLIQILRQYQKHYLEEPESIGGQSIGSSSRSSRLKTFLSFADEKEETVKSRSKRRKMERISYRSSVGSSSNKEDASRRSEYANELLWPTCLHGSATLFIPTATSGLLVHNFCFCFFFLF